LAGAQGVQGEAGATGSTGAAGPAGLVFRGAYVSATSYAVGDAVSFSGASYVSLVVGNVGQTPGLSPSSWGVLAVAGTVGMNGAAGAPGAVGAQGPQGVAGTIGPMGLQGVAGAAGGVGPQGAAGVQGPAGGIGLTGAVGPAGTAGAAGATGAPGAVGAQGPVGVAGPTGSSGAVGMNFRGPWTAATNYAVNDAVTFAGSTFLAESANVNREPDIAPQTWTVIAQAGGAGPTGAMGTAGVGATVALGTVTTLAAGSQATVSNSGTAAAAVLNFGIPQGAAGSGGSGGAVSGGNFAAVYHAVSFSTEFYAVNQPTAAAGETAAVVAWVPRGCSAVRLDVFSQQSNTVTVTLRNGPMGTMADTALSCAAVSGGSCTATGAVTVAAGSFIDLSVAGASGTVAGVWTALECD
jgi:collagen type VII alpha